MKLEPKQFLRIFLGIPVSFSLAGVAFLFGLGLFGDVIGPVFYDRLLGVSTESTMAAVPLFVLMESVLERSAIAERLFRVMQVWFGFMPAGPWVAAITMSAVFAAATGIIGAVEAVLLTLFYGEFNFGVLRDSLAKPLTVTAMVMMIVVGGTMFSSVFLVSATESHSQANVRRSVAQSLAVAADACRLHDTRGLGQANATAALDQGVRIVDASLGGLGGCPLAPKATGNIVMEDLVFLCEKMGFDTGIDLDALCQMREVLRRAMPDEHLYGGFARSGPPLGFQENRST